jgi:hypothetical protein
MHFVGMVSVKDLSATTIAGMLDYYGPEHLARILNVSLFDLHRWADGTARPPNGVFFRIMSASTRRTSSQQL